MAGFDDLRGFIERADQLGVLRRISGADEIHEIGAVTEVAAGLPDSPALLFDAIPGYPSTFRIFTNATITPQRAALALGIDPHLRPLDALREWKERRKSLRPIPPVEVGDSPFMANVMTGADVDLGRIPAPTWHGKDGGPYIGSGSLVVMRDPDSDWINASIYRIQVHGKNRVTIQFDHMGRHGAIIAKKYWEAGKPCPVAVVNGQDPTLFISGFEYLPEQASEYEFAGAIRGRPVETVSGPLTGLPLPAKAEIILEGHLLPMSEVQMQEGPFGEFTGYYAADRRPAPVMEVEAIYHRDDPILFGSPPMKPPRHHFGLPVRGAGIWSNLEAAGVTDIAGVWQHVSTMMTVVAISQRYAGHAKRAGLIAAAGNYLGRLIVVVDDDIDPSNLQDVMWAIATRCEPAEQIDIIRNGWSSGLDPRIPPAAKARGVGAHSKMIIDACRPFDWLDQFPPTTALSLKETRDIEDKWGALLKPGGASGR